MSYVLYHDNCYDGFGAAWAAWKHLGDDVTFCPVRYGEPPPMVPEGEPVFILDFSYDRSVLERMAKIHPLRVLDHHKTARAALAGLDFATFDLDKSGAVLAWEYFHRGKLIPQMVAYLQDRDLWQFKLPGSREVAAWMRSHPFDFRVWDYACTAIENPESFARVLSEGHAILRFQDQQVEIMANRAEFRQIGESTVPVVNATVFFSEVGEAMCLKFPDSPFAAYYLDQPNGKRQWGLRSRGGFDCSAVAKRYGGGGHPGAAGFVTDQNWREAL